MDDRPGTGLVARVPYTSAATALPGVSDTGVGRPISAQAERSIAPRYAVAPIVVPDETTEVTSGTDAPRRPEPPPELFRAREQLTQIAELLEAGDVEGARSTLYEMPIEQAHWYWMNASTLPTHRHENRVPTAGAVSRDMRLAVGSRDRWHCRYCRLPVGDVDYFNKLSKALPDDFPKARGTPVTGNGWPISRVFRMAPDHVVPLAAGGATSMDNLVAACGACNYQWKGDCTLDELDGELREPADPGWDGLVGRPRLP